MHLCRFHPSFPKSKYAHIIFEKKLKAPLLSDLVYFKLPPLLALILIHAPIWFFSRPLDNYCTIANQVIWLRSVFDSPTHSLNRE